MLELQYLLGGLSTFKFHNTVPLLKFAHVEPTLPVLKHTHTHTQRERERGREREREIHILPTCLDVDVL